MDLSAKRERCSPVHCRGAGPTAVFQSSVIAECRTTRYHLAAVTSEHKPLSVVCSSKAGWCGYGVIGSTCVDSCPCACGVVDTC